MQGIGQFAAGVMALITAAGFKASLSESKTFATCNVDCLESTDKMWRTIIGFGAVPGCIALYYRLTIPETPRYTFDVARDSEKAGSDVRAYVDGRPEGHPDELARLQALERSGALEIPKASWGDFLHHYGQWRYGKILLGTAGSWFFLDVAFYGLGLNNGVILAAIGYSGGSNVYQIVSGAGAGRSPGRARAPC
jgi:PHS family inorganic phosphate transporter-like MFS transporter